MVFLKLKVFLKKCKYMKKMKINKNYRFPIINSLSYFHFKRYTWLCCVMFEIVSVVFIGRRLFEEQILSVVSSRLKAWCFVWLQAKEEHLSVYNKQHLTAAILVYAITDWNLFTLQIDVYISLISAFISKQIT